MKPLKLKPVLIIHRSPDKISSHNPDKSSPIIYLHPLRFDAISVVLLLHVVWVILLKMANGLKFEAKILK
jgi:hypothetical protein